MPVGELLARTSGQELAEWAAYYRLEPWGEERADLRSGVVAALICNALRGKGGKVRAPQDFVLRFGLDARDAPRALWAKVVAAFKAVDAVNRAGKEK